MVHTIGSAKASSVHQARVGVNNSPRRRARQPRKQSMVSSREQRWQTNALVCASCCLVNRMEWGVFHHRQRQRPNAALQSYEEVSIEMTQFSVGSRKYQCSHTAESFALQSHFPHAPEQGRNINFQTDLLLMHKTQSRLSIPTWQEGQTISILNARCFLVYR